MLTATRKYTCYVLAGINVLVIVFMLLTGYSGSFNPTEHPYLAVSGLAYPGFVVCDFVFFVIWLLLNRRYLIIPSVGILINIGALLDYCPLNISTDHPQDCIKVVSYNVLGFNYQEAPENAPNEILQYIIDSKADFICIQEFNPDRTRQTDQWNEIDKFYPYIDTLQAQSTDNKQPVGCIVALLSKYPILSKERIPIVSKANLAGVFTVKMDGKTVRIINAHLETVGLSQEEKNGFHEIVKGEASNSTMEAESKTLVSKIAASDKIRAPQADSIAEYIRRHIDDSIILCGDFNDHPLSYVHNTIAENLTDCYSKTGCLPGYSFNHASMYVRIDNIMCSDNWKPYACRVDKSVKLSDHYPIICYFKQK